MNEALSPSQTPELVARSAGWVSELEYNGEPDGVRNPATGDWAENWVAAVVQIEDIK